MIAYIRRLWWRALRLVGLAQLSWDRQYLAGVWDRGPRSVHTVELVAALSKGGRIVEFGCGEGLLPHVLPDGCYADYLGLDISAIAIKRARQRAASSGKAALKFERCDMASWEGTCDLTLIVVEECLYYLDTPRCEAFLSSCSRSLLPEGRILVVVHSASRHSQTLDTCRRCCNVASETTYGSRVYLVLAAANSQGAK